MEILNPTDWIAMYGAALSTAIAIVALIQWLMSGIKAHVFVFNSKQSWPGQDKMRIVVSNAGTVPFVISSLRVSFYAKHSRRSEITHEFSVDQRSLMSPAIRSIKDDPSSNRVRHVANVIKPGEEYIGLADEPRHFEPADQLIRVQASIRNSRRVFVGWTLAANEVPNA